MVPHARPARRFLPQQRDCVTQAQRSVGGRVTQAKEVQATACRSATGTRTTEPRKPPVKRPPGLSATTIPERKGQPDRPAMVPGVPQTESASCLAQVGNGPRCSGAGTSSLGLEPAGTRLFLKFLACEPGLGDSSIERCPSLFRDGPMHNDLAWLGARRSHSL